MNQNERRCFSIAGFLVVNTNTINIDEVRMFGMKNDVATLIPVSIAWTQEQLTGNSGCCGTCDPISFLHLHLYLSHR